MTESGRGLPDGPERSRALLRPVHLALVVGTVIAITGPLYRIRTWWSYEDPLATDAAVIAVQGLVTAAALVALIRRRRWRRVDHRLAVVALVLAAWLVLGSSWSRDPSTTVRESLQIAGTLAAGSAVALVVRERALVVCAWVGIHIGLGWSAIAIKFVAAGTQDQNGDWAGVFFNPNSLALVAGVGIVLSVALLVGLRDQPWRWPLTGLLLAAVGADLVLIAGSGALTPLAALVAAAAVALSAHLARGLVRRGSAPSRVVGFGGGLLLVLAGALWFTRRPLLHAIGRTGDITGRVELWRVSLDWFERRPVIGFGYLGAWSDHQFLADIAEARGTVLGSAHGSFIEILLGTGIVGFALVLVLVALVWSRVGIRAVSGSTSWDLWPLALFVFWLVENLTETVLVGNHLLVAVFGALGALSTSSQPASQPSVVDPVEHVVPFEGGS